MNPRVNSPPATTGSPRLDPLLEVLPSEPGALLQLVFDCMAEAVVMADASGKVVLMGAAARRLIGLEPDAPLPDDWTALRGRYLADGHTPVPRDRLLVSRALRGEFVDHEIFCFRRDESAPRVWVDGCARPIAGADGTIRGCIVVWRDVSARIDADTALLETDSWLGKIAATVPGVICSFRLRPDGTASLPFATAGLQDLYGLHPREVRDDATPLFARIDPADVEHVNASIAASAAGMAPWRDEFRYHHPSKGEIWVEGHSMPEREADGSILWHGYLQDVTERKRMENALTDSERLYRAIGESIDFGIWVSAPDGRNIYASESFLRLVGLTQEQCSNFGWGEVLHPEDAASTLAAWQECVRQGSLWDMEHRYRGTDGAWHAVLARGVPVRNERGEITLWAGINLDISRLKRAEDALAASESRYRLAMLAVAGVVFDWDRASNRVEWSSGLMRIFGVNIDDPMRGRRWWQESVHPDDLRRIRPTVLKAIRGDRDQLQLDYRMRHADGHWVHVSDRTHIVRNAAGLAVRLIGSLADISARVAAEEELRRVNDTLEEQVAERSFEAEARARALAESERFAHATVDALNSTLCVLDARGQIIAVNKSWREFASENGGDPATLGEGADYLATCDKSARAGCATAAQVARAIRAAIAGTRSSFSLEYECSSPRERRWYMLKMTCFPGWGPLRLLVVHENVSERKLAAEAEIESARRLKRMTAHLETVREEQSATLAREVHDELGGTLTMLKLGLASTVEGMEISTEMRERFNLMLDQVDQALQTVKRISAGLRPAMLDTLGLIATINWYAAEFTRLTRITTAQHLPEYVRLSAERSTAVFRIVQEALTNVAKHSGATKVSIEMRKHRGNLILEVSDNGVGLSADSLQKPDSFGLIGMHERAQYLGGQLSISRSPAAGTCLTLQMPLDERKTQQEAP